MTKFGAGASILAIVPALLYSQSAPRRKTEGATHAQKAAEYLQANRPAEAAREFTAILAADPKNVDARTNLGVLLFFSGDYAKAAPELREALRLRGQQPKTEALLGLCEKRLGEVGSAREHLAHSFPLLADEKLKAQTGLELAEIDYSANRLDDAAATIAEVRRLRPADPDVLYAAHRIYSDLADECTLSVAAASPDSARMQQLLGNELSRRGKVAGAIEKYRAAIRLDPHLPGVHFQLAESLSAAESPDERDTADREYEAALLDNPLDAKAQARLGARALERTDLQNALARYTRALELEPSDGDANLGMAKVLMANGQTARAEPFLLRALRADPFEPVTHMRLSTLYRQTGRAAEAAREVAEFRRLREIRDKIGEVYHGRSETPQ